jgi:hypothetical protein
MTSHYNKKKRKRKKNRTYISTKQNHPKLQKTIKERGPTIKDKKRRRRSEDPPVSKT